MTKQNVVCLNTFIILIKKNYVMLVLNHFGPTKISDLRINLHNVEIPIQWKMYYHLTWSESRLNNDYYPVCLD